MNLSIFELFKIGVGPSSSHTVGPMWAAHRFLLELETRGSIQQTKRVRADLFGSLALTGHGHATDKAVLLGLSGEVPDQIDPDRAGPIVHDIETSGRLKLQGNFPIPFTQARDLIFNFEESLPYHPNGLRFTAFDDAGTQLYTTHFYSVGGGFVISEAEISSGEMEASHNIAVPYMFRNARELLALGEKNGLSIADMVRENELTRRSPAELAEGLANLVAAMDSCLERGLTVRGTLPGGLNVKRRAPELYSRLLSAAENQTDKEPDPLSGLDWVNVFALAVNEENAAGGRVVTAPTNGAAGVIPAVLTYYRRFYPSADNAGVERFLLTAAAIGSLYKTNASISAAEVGCQGEVGVACSMAAGGLTAALNGNNQQIEHAAEVGMEHNLGLTCDPVGGLVQIPCIERNTMGAVKAINAARIALAEDGQHKISLDSVIETMRQTGADMSDKYKETSKGGLAVNSVAC